MTAYLNSQIEYKTVQWNARDLQLVEARNANAVDIARLLNLPPMAVNAETNGSLTYSTTESQGRQLINTTLVPYMAAVTGRLSMDDVTIPGLEVSVIPDAFLQTDTPTRMTAYATGIASGVLTVNEARAKEGLPPL